MANANINITVDPVTYAVNVYSRVLGYSGEDNSRVIIFKNYEIEQANLYKLRMQYADGAVYDVALDSDGSYTIESAIMRIPGFVDCQLLAVNDDGTNYTYIKKTPVFRLEIKRSVDENAIAIPTYKQSIDAYERVARVNASTLDGAGVLTRYVSLKGDYADKTISAKAGQTIYVRFVECKTSGVKKLQVYGFVNDETSELLGSINNENLPSEILTIKLEKDYKYIQFSIDPYSSDANFTFDYLLSSGYGVQPELDQLHADVSDLESEVAKKVNISDIINNTASTDTDKPLSANQGKVLADRITSDENDILNLQTIKVDKVDGKGLSTNDYTDEEKSQVATNKTDILSLQNVLTALGLSVDSDGYIVQEV